MPKHPYSLPAAILMGLFLAVVDRLIQPDLNVLTTEVQLLVQDELTALLLIPVLIFAVAFLRWLPNARARFFNIGHLPAQTLVHSRILVLIIGTSLIGQAVGNGVLAVLVDSRYWFFVVVYSLSLIPFIVSAERRFRRHPSTEWVMPMCPYRFPLIGKM